MTNGLRVFSNAGEVFRAGAEEFVRAAQEAIRERGRFAAALSGGSTPRGLYALLADDKEPFRPRLEWGLVHFFWGDERCVPPDHPESNFRMAREALLSKIPLPPENVHRVRTEWGEPADIAEDYDKELRRFFDPGDGGLPQFDLILLGMGADGHTASLFPRTEALGEREKLVAANWVEKLGAHRITLTLRLINNAARVLFLVTGPDKAKALESVLRGPWRPAELPAQAVRPTAGGLLWLADAAAASSFGRGGEPRA